MKLLPSSIWHSPTTASSPSMHETRSQPVDQPTTFLSSSWRSFILGNPPTKRSSPLEKRKDKTVTVTDTVKVTESVFSTIYFNQTITSHLATTIWSTRDITHFQTATITQNLTATTPSTVSRTTTKSTMHVPTQTKAEVSQGTAMPSTSPLPQKHRLSTPAIVGIVFGVLAFVALAIGVLFLVRRFYRMYRRERVMRKQLQTEGNEMPAMKTGDQEVREQRTGGF